ncbi:4897_t:CDS:1, partial [Gigaspora margarita]
TFLTMASQQTESIMDPGQPQLLILQIGQYLVPDDKVPSSDTEVLTLALESTTISSEETSEGMEIDLNLDTVSVTSTIESDGLQKLTAKLLVALKHLDKLPTQLY